MVYAISRGRKIATLTFATAFAGAVSATPILAQEADESLDWLVEDEGAAPQAEAAPAAPAAPAAAANSAEPTEAEAIIADGATAPPAPKSGPRLDEIIVTAQKRAENVQDVPISVTAIGGETIKDNNISNLNDLSLYTPNVKLQAVAPFGRINMRGLGSGTNRGFEQSVGLVIDGVFFARLQYLLDAMLDLERVEALRGPQGTLFGKNTIAGALNIASGNPEPDFRTEGDITFGEQELNRVRVMATGPIDENGDLAFRIAATRDRKDGHNYNTFLQRDESNTRNDAVRAKLRWQPSATVDLTGGVTWSNFKQKTWGIQFTQLEGNMAPIYASFDPNLEADGENYEGQADHPGFNARETWIGGLTANWELGDWILTSVTGYSNYLEDGDIDADGGPMPYITLGALEDYTQWSQEIRVASPPGDIEFVAGLYYFYSETDIATHVGLLPVADPFSDVATILLPAAVSSLLGPVAGPVLAALGQAGGAESADLGFFQTSSSYAAFGQANWHILEDLTLVVGARYTMEEKEVEQFQVLNGPGVLTGPLVADWEAYEFTDVRREYSFSPKLALQYVYDEDIMFYGSVSKGFKGGGYNASASRDDELEYEPENAMAYEMGMKSEFLDGAARANVSVFYTEFNNLQVSVFSSTQFVVRNAADAVTQGVEFEFMMTPLEGLMLMASGAYTDAYFLSYEKGTCKVGQAANPDGNCDLTGQTLQRAPKWTGNFSVSYLAPLGSLPFNLVTGVDLLYQDDFFLADDNDPLDAQEAYMQVNARIGIRADDEAWSFMIFGRNLTDEAVKVTAADAPLAEESHFAVYEPPRLISAEFTARF